MTQIFSTTYGDIEEEDFLKLQDNDQQMLEHIIEVQNRTEQYRNNMIPSKKSVGKMLRKPFLPAYGNLIIRDSIVESYHNDVKAVTGYNNKTKDPEKEMFGALWIVCSFYDIIKSAKEKYRIGLESKCDMKCFSSNYIANTTNLSFEKKLLFNDKSWEILFDCNTHLVNKDEPVSDVIGRIKHSIDLIYSMRCEAEKW